MNIKDPVQLFEIFENMVWDNKEDIIKDITEKLKEFGYSTEDITRYITEDYTNDCYINFLCEHDIICGYVWIYEDGDDGYSFDISEKDVNGNLNECSICKKIIDKNKIILDRKTIEEIIKLIESEEYVIVDDDIIISDEDGIVLTLKEILKGRHEKYKTEQHL